MPLKILDILFDLACDNVTFFFSRPLVCPKNALCHLVQKLKGLSGSVAWHVKSWFTS